jgi:hypothetical protein
VPITFNIICSATERLSSYRASEEIEVLPLIQFFSMIQLVDTILQMVHTYFSEEIVSNFNFLPIWALMRASNTANSLIYSLSNSLPKI